MEEKTFNDLGLSGEALQAVEAMGYVTPTPIQEQTIPLVLAGKDVVGAADWTPAKQCGDHCHLYRCNSYL